MMTNRKALVCFVLSCVFTGTVPQAQAQQVKGTIGGIMPLSGPAATYGQSFANAVPLATDMLKKLGVDITVVTEDGAADVSTSIAAYNKLVRVNNVSAIVHAVSPVVLTLGPMGEKDKIVLVNAMAGAPQIANIGPYTFSTMPSYQIEGTDAAKFAYAHGARKVFGLYQDTAAGKPAWDVFKVEFEKLGGKMVGEEGFKAGSTEYRAHLSRATSTSPDWVYLSSYAAETGRILAQAHRMDLTTKVKFIGIVGADNPETVTIGGPGAENFIHASWPFDPENGTAQMKVFGSAYKQKYGAPPSVYAASSYDSIVIIGQAIKAGAKSGPEIQEFLSKKLGEVDGVTGKWRFNAKGQIVLKTSFVQIKNGKRIPIN